MKVTKIFENLRKILSWRIRSLIKSILRIGKDNPSKLQTILLPTQIFRFKGQGTSLVVTAEDLGFCQTSHIESKVMTYLHPERSKGIRTQNHFIATTKLRPYLSYFTDSKYAIVVSKCVIDSKYFIYKYIFIFGIDWMKIKTIREFIFYSKSFQIYLNDISIKFVKYFK